MKLIQLLFTVVFLNIFVCGSGFCGELEPLFPGYPEVFDVNGTLDSVFSSENRLVVNDFNYTITSKTTFNTPDGPASIKNFSENDRVGIIREEGTRNLVSLWLIEKVKTKPQKTKTPQNSVKMENGVWKN